MRHAQKMTITTPPDSKEAKYLRKGLRNGEQGVKYEAGDEEMT
jgi:hypothetical protein